MKQSTANLALTLLLVAMAITLVIVAWRYVVPPCCRPFRRAVIIYEDNLPSILLVRMRCLLCEHRCSLGETIPDEDDTLPHCPKCLQGQMVEDVQ